MQQRTCPKLADPRKAAAFSWSRLRDSQWKNSSTFIEATVMPAKLVINKTLTTDRTRHYCDKGSECTAKDMNTLVCDMGNGCPAGDIQWSAETGKKVDCITVPEGIYTTAKGLSCSPVHRTEDCPVFGSTVADVTGSNNKTYDGKHTAACSYDTAALTSSCADITAYTEYVRGQNGDYFWFDDDMMVSLCGKRGAPGTCPDQTSTYKDANGIICSNMIACPLCREWAASSQSTTTAKGLGDQVMKSWCDTNSSTASPLTGDPACQCINRDYMPVVQKMQGLKEVDPLCWFVPCVDRQLKKSLVPSDQRAPTCPDTVCTQVMNFADDQGISVDDMQQYMNCNGSKPSPTPTPTPTPSDGGSSSGWDSLSTNQKTALLTGGGLGVFLLLGGAFWLMTDDE